LEESVEEENDLALAIEEEKRKGRLLDQKCTLELLRRENAKKCVELNEARRQSIDNSGTVEVECESIFPV